MIWEKGRTHSPLAARTIEIAVGVAASIKRLTARLALDAFWG
jgi:hypothetical protein